MILPGGLPFVTTSPVIAAAVAVLLVAISVPVIRRFSARESDPAWVRRLLWAALAAHLLGACIQLLVVKDIYHNVADYVGYESLGAHIAQQLHHGSLSFGHLNIPGDDMVSVVVGLLYTVMPADALGGFLVFAWIGFAGLMLFYRAVRTALPDADMRRYGVLVFFFPSLVYWPSATGKESLMLLALGAASLGAARLLTHQSGWRLPALAGLGLAILVRPHEAALAFGGIAIALLTRRSRRATLLAPLRWTFTIVALIGGSVAMLFVVVHFLGLGSLSATALTNAVQQVNANTVGTGGSGFGSSFTNNWSPSPLHYPIDVFTVLFRPLPWQAAGFTQLIAAAENLLIIGLIFASVRRLLHVPALMFRSPFVMSVVVYIIGFIYLFSAFGNLGLLIRERTLLLPFLLVLFVVPRPQARETSLADTARMGSHRGLVARLRPPPPPAIELLH